MNAYKNEPVRKTALHIVLNVEHGNKLQNALDNALIKSQLSIVASRQCTDSVYTYFRMKIRALWILDCVLSNREKLPTAMTSLLVLAVVSLIGQSGNPHYAVVHETVELIKKQFGKKMAGVANGALHSILRLGHKVHDKEWYLSSASADEPLNGLAIYYSIPLPLARLWHEAYGLENTLLLMKRSSARPWKGILFNSHLESGRILRDWFRQQQSENIVMLGEWGAAMFPGMMPASMIGRSIKYWLNERALSYQAAGSQIILEKLGITDWSEKLFDCCAGVGGKSRALANSNVDVSLAADLSEKRLRIFDRSWPYKNMERPALLQMDMLNPALKRWSGDIIADVPCSGFGVLAGRPDLREHFFEFSSHLEKLQNIQTGILENAAILLKPGSRLAYITCTLNPQENQDMIKNFLSMHSGMLLEREWQTPFDHPWLEGMYGAVMVKKY